MRRKDKEVTDAERIARVIDGCQVCRLGFQDGKSVYVVPVNFGHVEREGRHVLYFHGASAGRKFDLIRKNGYAGFEMDTNYQLKSGETACKYTCTFQSIVGEGPIQVVEDPAEKRAGLVAIMRQSTGREQWTFSDEMVAAVCVSRLDVEMLSCKEYR